MESLLVVSFQGLGQDLSCASSSTPCWPCILELLAEGECIAAGAQPTEITQGMAMSESTVSSADSCWYHATHEHGVGVPKPGMM